MFRPRIIPVLLLKNKGLVKTIKFKDPRYIGDPINAVKVFNDLKADELIFLDITAGIENRTVSLEVIRNISDEACMPFAVGGGIMTLEQAADMFNSGAEKVVINSYAIRRPELIKEIAAVYGSQSIVVSVDVKKTIFGKSNVFFQSGKIQSHRDLVEHIQELEYLGAGEIMINSIDRDGCMSGYDIELIKTVSEAVTIPVIACGGAGQPEDLKKAVLEGKANAAAAGSMFVFHGPLKAVLLSYPSVDTLRNLFYS